MAVLLLIFAGDKVFGFLKDRGVDLPKLSRQLEELHQWHDREDEDGVKVWYVRKTLESAIERLSENIATQTKILQEMHRENKVMHAENKAIQVAMEQFRSEFFSRGRA